jgi:NADPH:quinone reductase-like Zn-dependent oxidoreductase
LSNAAIFPECPEGVKGGSRAHSRVSPGSFDKQTFARQSGTSEKCPESDVVFDAIGGAHFRSSFACLASGGLLIGYGSQTMAVGREGLASAALGLVRLKLWGALGVLFGGRRAAFYSITARRLAHPEEFKTDMATLFELLRDGAIHPAIIDRLPLADAREVHARIDAGGLGGKIVLLPWPAS